VNKPLCDVVLGFEEALQPYIVVLTLPFALFFLRCGKAYLRIHSTDAQTSMTRG
jgi:hypothetical protein